ncbi:D-Ala-D-Ala carboxypeptidase family metallohydrolase [Sphingomonas jaspsi]|uniref:D-Ala-D-Ala carboxypeptidase family metallohydrolase n=1 Tax=Sphingomonas jaspsi TaxID=392409 RepID=UPI0004B23B1A|nr:D-Ala-D-Ala carboxypeptidase family metallohydrolase [Sphingomonas jaspsi]
MKRLLLILPLVLASQTAADAQSFNPAADYVTAGQDEPGYRAWMAGASWRPTYVKAFNDYLAQYGVAGVVPTWQLLRTATDWRKCGADPFEVPPTSGWPNIVAALRYIGTYVEPRIGPVEAVSVYRNPALNSCAGGAPESTHRTVGAIDMVPLRPVTRGQLMTMLCDIHVRDGSWNNIGLGFYKGVRFHIDAKKYREWGTAGAAGGFGCTAVLAQGPMPTRPDIGPPPLSPAPPPMQPTLSPGFKVISAPPSTPAAKDPLAPTN